MTKQNLLIAMLSGGRTLSTDEIRYHTDLSNPYEAIRRLRHQGYCIYKNENGYRLGTPKRSMVSMVMALKGGQAFN